MRTNGAEPLENFDQYLNRLPAEQRAELQKIRARVHVLLPEVEEAISYQLPTFRLNGKNLLHLGAAKNHCAIYPGAAPVQQFAAELSAFDTSKGTIRFTPEIPLPDSLVDSLIQYCADENRRKHQKSEKKPKKV